MEKIQPKTAGGVQTNGFVPLFLHFCFIAASVLFTAGQSSVRKLLIISAFPKERQNGLSASPYFSLECPQHFLETLSKKIFTNLL